MNPRKPAPKKTARKPRKKRRPEDVNHPRHYNAGRFEVIEVIEDWDLGFNDGNAVKYIARAKHKGERLQDLKKAAWYLAREIATIEKAGKKSPARRKGDVKK